VGAYIIVAKIPFFVAKLILKAIIGAKMIYSDQFLSLNWKAIFVAKMSFEHYFCCYFLDFRAEFYNQS